MSLIELERPLTKTEEQLHIIDLVARYPKQNLCINAYAGTGKTTALEMLCEYLTEPVLYLVFNKNNRIEAQERFAKKVENGVRFPPYEIKTVNGLGYGVWRQTYPGAPDARKCGNIFREIAKDLPKSERNEANDSYSAILSAVGLAKSFGYVPEGKFPNAKRLIEAEAFFAQLDEEPSDLFQEIVNEILLSSIKAAYSGNIDFDDQIYMPTLFGGAWPRFPTVIVDEFQDFNAVNHEMLSKLKGSRIIAVGDPFQSIYAFRGAVQNGMRKAKERFDMMEASLSVCFRCPSEIVRNAHWRVPDLKWVKEGGYVEHLSTAAFNNFPDGCAIICRNNAPLFSLALKLLASGRSVSVRGSDLGPKVVAIMKKLGPESLPQEDLLDRIEEWRIEKLERGSKSADDTADCMRVFAGVGQTLRHAIAYAEDLFRQSGTIYLTTGHKAKGLEWGVVSHLDPWIIGESDQELNLRYVIQTRSKGEYYEINTTDIQ
jgi:ATP-dependent DNA helicase UvrD/PcrA